MSFGVTAFRRMVGPPLEVVAATSWALGGPPASTASVVKHEDAVDQFGHHESVLQNYRAMFLVSETFSVSVAATRLDNRGLVLPTARDSGSLPLSSQRCSPFSG